MPHPLTLTAVHHAANYIILNERQLGNVHVVALYVRRF
jgi:hypothetical protein